MQPTDAHFSANKLVYPAFALLGLIWGTNFIFMKWAAVYITPAQIVLLRILFGFVPILVLALVRRSLEWSHMRYIHHFFVMALLATAIYYFAFAKGTALLPSGIAGMLSGAIPLFSFLTAFAFLRQEPINRYTLFGLVLGFAGVLLIARPWNSGASAVNVEGVLYMMGGSLSVGCSFVYARRFLVPKEISPLALTTYQIGLALFVMWLFTDLNGIWRIKDDGVALTGLVVGLGLTGTGLAYVLYYFIVQHLGALRASGVTYIPPVVALVIGGLLVHEPLHTQDFIAMMLILSGVYVLQTGKRLVPVKPQQ
jgi:drug/metabolite transporter (DMT)-like permease